MTSQSDRIQSLVEQINSILADSSPSEPGMASEYQVLEQTRQQLANIQQSSTDAQSPPQTVTEGSQLVVNDWQNDWQTPAPVLAESAQQVLQSIVQEMAYLRMNTVQPLREEITRLQQERGYLATEVQQLQQQRQQLILAQQTDQQQMINGFLHALMGRLQEQLTQQVAQTMVSISGDTAVPLVSASNEQVVQLDSTLKVLFDSLQASVDTYQDSLEHSLRKMHGLGQQGEAMFTAFVNRLAGQLGREASLHLRPASSPDLSLPTQEESASLEPGAAPEVTPEIAPEIAQGTDEGPELTASVPENETEDEIAPDHLNQLLENALEEPVGSPPNVQSPPSVDLNDTETSIPSNSQNLLDPEAVSTPEFDPNPAANAMLDQIIDQLENNEIDAVEALDNLDLGFGLDELELADMPISLADDDTDDESAREPEQNTLNFLSQESQENQEGQEKQGSQESVNPISLGSGLELDAPLELAANIHMDKDESDVDRFMDAINQPQDDPPTTFDPGLMGINDPEQTISNQPLLSDRPSLDLSIMEPSSSSEDQSGILQSLGTVQDSTAAPALTPRKDGGIADVSQSELQMDDMVQDSDDDSEFLLQQLSSELYDDVLGEEFLDTPRSRQDDFPSTSTPHQDDSSISFLINAPVAPPPVSLGDTDLGSTDLGNTDLDYTGEVDDTVSSPDSIIENNPSQDLYASFIDDNSTLVDIPTSSTDFDGLGGIESLSDLDGLRGEEPSETDESNTWSAWTNHLDKDETEDQSSSMDLASTPQVSGLGPSSSTPVVDTIHSLRDLIEETGIASSPPVSFPDSPPPDLASSNNYESTDETTYRSPSLDLFSDLEAQTPAGLEAQEEASSYGGEDWGALGNPAPASPSSFEDQAQREAEILAGLDLRLDANTMSELANDLSEMEDSTADLYGQEEGLASFGSDMDSSVPLPPPLIPDTDQPSDTSSLETSGLDNPEDNAIEALQGLFGNGDERAESEWDVPSEPPATNMQEFFADNVLSSPDVSTELASQSNQADQAQKDSGDLFGTFDGGAQTEEPNNNDAEELPSVSWTLDELIANDLPSSSSTVPTAKPNINSPTQTSFDLESNFGDEFEDDGLANLMNDLQSEDEPDNSPLTGVEDAKTLADLLRSQNSPSKPSSEDKDPA